jgi:hypothetical protein
VASQCRVDFARDRFRRAAGGCVLNELCRDLGCGSLASQVTFCVTNALARGQPKTASRPARGRPPRARVCTNGTQQ